MREVMRVGVCVLTLSMLSPSLARKNAVPPPPTALEYTCWFFAIWSSSAHRCVSAFVCSAPYRGWTALGPETTLWLVNDHSQRVTHIATLLCRRSAAQLVAAYVCARKDKDGMRNVQCGEHVVHTNVRADAPRRTQYIYSLYCPRASVSIPRKLIELLTDL